MLIDDLNGILDDFLLSLGLSVKILKDYPTCDNGEVVCDLRPYFLEKVNDKIRVKKLKRNKKIL